MNVLITGVSGGIGYELAKYFAMNRAKTIFLVSRNNEKIEELKKECQRIYVHTKIIALAFDLENEISFSEIKNAVAAEVNQLDYLINNAGYLINKPFKEILPSEISKIYSVNVFAPFRLIQTLLPLMGQQTKAHIVNIGSMGGVQGSVKFAGLSAYASSKMALAGLTECIAEELKENKLVDGSLAVAINCLALGAVQTEMLAAAFPGYQAPLKPNEMAEFIGNFTITGHKFFNGKILPVALSTP